MVTIIKKGDSPEHILEKLKKLRNKKGFNAKKHLGVIHLSKSPLQIQKELRDEWE